MKQFTSILVFTPFITTFTQASAYQHLSTSELEKAVEKHSLNGTLPYEMGLELIRRWTQR